MNDLNREEPSRYVMCFALILSLALFSICITRLNQHTLSYLFCHQASLKECHFLIDLDTAHSTEREPRYSQSTADWQVIHQLDFVDAAK